MTNSFRKFLGATQAAGGGIVVALPGILYVQGSPLAWWYWILLGSFGWLAIAGGVWLWRNEPRGWELSRLLQAMQIVQFQTSSFGAAAMTGVQLRLFVSATNVEVGPGFKGAFGVTYGESMPWWVSINFFSAYALYALLRSGPVRNPISALFTPEPTQWGLRGDPYLWRKMRERLSDDPRPENADELVAILQATFQQLAGRPVSHDAHIFIERYSHGGMSSGMVSPAFWRDTAIPLLRQRYVQA